MHTLHALVWCPSEYQAMSVINLFSGISYTIKVWNEEIYEKYNWISSYKQLFL